MHITLLSHTQIIVPIINYTYSNDRARRDIFLSISYIARHHQRALSLIFWGILSIL